MLESKKFNDSVVPAFLECSCDAFRIWSSNNKNPYPKYVSSHFLTLAIELNLLCFGLRASYI